MGYNNFINNGSIDLEQIQLEATFPNPPDPGQGSIPMPIPMTPPNPMSILQRERS